MKQVNLCETTPTGKYGFYIKEKRLHKLRESCTAKRAPKRPFLVQTCL